MPAASKLLPEALRDAHMYVAGEWRAGADRAPIVHPFSLETIATVPTATPADVDLAITAAQEGARAMRRLTAWERTLILRQAADLADQHVEELAALVSLEAGKTLVEARGEASRAGEILRLSAEEGARMHGETLPLDASANGAGRFGFTVRQPCGVVVAISPFNFPVLLCLHKVGPALAAGNAVVLKPARQTPLAALRLCQFLLEAGLPPLALQVITGSGSELGPVLCADERVRKISFTGSTEVGRQIASVAGVKRLSLELGASCPVLVLSDADVEAAAAAIAIGGYANAGQVCISVQRVLVDRRVHADLLDALRPKVEAIVAGDPLADDTAVGPLISVSEAERVEATIRGAVASGATLVAGGQRDRTVVQPAIVDNVDPRTPLSREELFGPAIAITPVDGAQEAIRLANDSSYGLGAGVFTKDIEVAMRFVREVDAGALHVNWTPLWRADLMPYGGLSQSGVGKEGPRYAVDEMTELKTIVFHPHPGA